MHKHYSVRAEWDADAGVWFVTSSDIPGLVTEAETIDALAAKVEALVPELLEANGLICDNGQADVELIIQ